MWNETGDAFFQGTRNAQALKQLLNFDQDRQMAMEDRNYVRQRRETDDSWEDTLRLGQMLQGGARHLDARGYVNEMLSPQDRSMWDAAGVIGVNSVDRPADPGRTREIRGVGRFELPSIQDILNGKAQAAIAARNNKIADEMALGAVRNTNELRLESGKSKLKRLEEEEYASKYGYLPTDEEADRAGWERGVRVPLDVAKELAAIAGTQLQNVATRQKVTGQEPIQPYQWEQLSHQGQVFGETRRHNQATEGLTARGQNITAGNAARSTGQHQFSNETTLRHDFTNASKEYAALSDAYQRIRASGQGQNGANDISLLYGFMKLLDPNSVVRESEFQIGQNAGSLPQRWNAAYQKAVSGQRLDPQTRNDILAQAEQIYRTASEKQSGLTSQYRGLAERGGLNPSNVLIDFGVPHSTGSGPKADPVGIR